VHDAPRGGRPVFHIFAFLAEFERNLLQERTMVRRQAARARARKGSLKSEVTGQGFLQLVF
jgi:DNA invertase Pin-like site-specific DNA recombinase